MVNRNWPRLLNLSESISISAMSPTITLYKDNHKYLSDFISTGIILSCIFKLTLYAQPLIGWRRHWVIAIRSWAYSILFPCQIHIWTNLDLLVDISVLWTLQKWPHLAHFQDELQTRLIRFHFRLVSTRPAEVSHHFVSGDHWEVHEISHHQKL